MRLAKVGIVTAAGLVALVLLLTEPFICPENLPAGMHPAAPQRCVAVFVFCMALWFTSFIPLAATGLLVLALLPLLNVLDERATLALFGNSAVFFMLGVFLLAAATISTGLSKRITLLALHRFGGSSKRLVTGVTMSAAFLSLWMPEHAVAAMIYPIVVETVESLQLPKGHNYARKLFLGLAWGAIIGGVGTFLGGARAPLALSLLREEHPGVTVSFLGWMVAALPVVVLAALAAVLGLHRWLRDDCPEIHSATVMLRERVRRLGRMSGPERRLAVLALLTVLAWITVGHAVGLAVIALLSATLLFFLRIVDWKSIQGYVNWGVLVMYGGAVALGSAVTETGAVDWLAHRLVPGGIPGFGVLAVLAAVAIMFTEVISNAAAVAILLPIGLSLGKLAGLDPVAVTMAVTIPAGLSFMLPISSPPNAISYSAGHYGVQLMARLGVWMNVVCYIIMLATMWLWWPLLGLRSW